MSRPDAPTREPPARRVPAAQGRPSSRRPGASSSSAAMPPRPSSRSATARILLKRRYTGCSLRSSASSRPCWTSLSEVTTRRLPWRTAPRFVRFLRDDDPKKQLAGFAALLREVMARVGPVHRILADAGRSDEDAAALLAEIARQRHEGQRRMARSLAIGRLAIRAPKRDAADIIHALASPEVYGLLVFDRGWRAERYEKWLRSNSHRPASPRRPLGLFVPPK